MKAAHSMMPLPATIGRIIGMPRKSAIRVDETAEDRETETATETRH
jgi:acyl-CoA thioester hydrolase